MRLRSSSGLTLVHGEDRQEPIVTTIGQLPIMVGSVACNLYGMSDDERVSHGEDAFDPGAYFIVNGTERVLMTLEDLASNKIMTEFTERYNERIYVAKVFSQFRGYRALVVVERNKKNLLEVSFPSVAGHLKFVDLMRALGMTNDQEVVNAVSTDEDILTFMMQNLEESECDSVEGGVMYVGKKLAPNQTKDYQKKRAEFVLDNYLLPHLNYALPATLKEGDEGYAEAVASVRLAKAHFLGRMAEACFDLVLNKRRIDDKDHYSNKTAQTRGRPYGGSLPYLAQPPDPGHQVPARTGEHAAPRPVDCNGSAGPMCSPKGCSTRLPPVTGWAGGPVCPSFLTGSITWPCFRTCAASSPHSHVHSLISRPVTCTRPSGAGSARAKLLKGRTAVS